MPPAIFVDAAPGSAPGAFNGVRFDVPTSARPRDTAIMAMLAESTNDGPDVDALAEDGWEELGPFVGATHTLWAFRRELGASESAHVDVEFTEVLANPPIGILLVYRNLNNGADVVGSSSTNVAASVNYVHPSRALTTYSDIYIGISAVENDEVSFTPPAGGTERIEHAGDGLSLYAFDVLLEATGATGTKTSIAGGASTGFAVSIALAADPLIGFGKSFVVEPLGAIGLPSRGV